MGFKVDAIAYISSATNKGNYTNAHIMISKKLKTEGETKYFTVFSAYANFFGKAHSQHPLQGQKIRLKEVDVTNAYLDRDGQQQYNKVANFAVYDYELLNNMEEKAPSLQNIDNLTDDVGLPF